MLLKLAGRGFTRILKALRLPAMVRIVQEFGAHQFQLLLIFILGFVVAAIQPVSVKLSEKIVNELQKGRGLEPAFFRWVPLTLVVVFLVSGLAKYFHNSWRRYLVEEVICRFRERLYRKYLILPLSVLDKQRTGEMLSGLQNDLNQISTGIDTLCLAMKEPFSFLGLIGVAFYCTWKLTLCTLVMAPVIAFLFSRSGWAVKRYSERNLSQFSDLLSLGQESIVGARIVKVFKLEKPLADRFCAIQNSYLQTIWKSIRVQELATPVVEFLGAILISGVLIYGGSQVLSGQMTSGQLVAFVIAIGLAQMPIKQLNNAYLKLKTAEAAGERLFRMLDAPDTQVQRGGLRRIGEFRDRIRFEGVSLVYDEKPALSEVSFEVRRGETVALVGSSGSGKTSIINLLPRLYEVTKGRITLDGTDIRDFYLADLRGLMSFVTQDTFLFNDTVYNNIRYGNPAADKRMIERAAEHAHCTDFVRGLSGGFEARVGDRGMLLSGGERQRVAIARAFLKGAPILVLDEATSNLDSQSEAIVQAALDELISGRTTFIVAHRLSTVRRADQIFVLENGQIVESGKHESLVTRAGRYSQYLAVQGGVRC